MMIESAVLGNSQFLIYALIRLIMGKKTAVSK